MKFEKVFQKIKDVPFIDFHNAKRIYSFILKNKPLNILELGIAHGTATCYMAAALDELGRGKIDCVDLESVKDWFVPTPEIQLESLGLEKYAEIYRMKTGYNWFLHNQIKSRSPVGKTCFPKYDLIIIDGPKNWTIDSSSFFLSDKLLKKNGWIIWDDYSWTYEDADNRRSDTDGIVHKSLSKEEFELPHIKEIFHLLVMQHPAYDDFKIKGGWAWARKKRTKMPTKKIKNASNSTYKVVKNLIPNHIKTKANELIHSIKTR